MTTQLIFKSHVLEVIEHQGKSWFTAATLAVALGYSRGDHVTRIYNRNADEFTPCMSINVNLTFNGLNNSLRQKSVRVFSLRGAHLIAMFASTPVAKEFRKWLLDILDREVRQTPTVIASPALNSQGLPKGVYRCNSRRNPYYSQVCVGGKNIYVGCFPTIEDAVAAQRRYPENGRVERTQPGLSATEQDLFTGNLQAVLHNFRRIDEIWRTQLRPALKMMDSKLVYLLHDRFNDSMCVLPTIERRIGRYIPPELPR